MRRVCVDKEDVALELVIDLDRFRQRRRVKRIARERRRPPLEERGPEPLIDVELWRGVEHRGAHDLDLGRRSVFGSFRGLLLFWHCAFIDITALRRRRCVHLFLPEVHAIDSPIHPRLRRGLFLGLGDLDEASLLEASEGFMGSVYGEPADLTDLADSDIAVDPREEEILLWSRVDRQ